jgi:hypothetical protein
MKLAITTKGNLEDSLFKIAYETIEKYSGLNACAKIELDGIDLSDLKQDGNSFVYIGEFTDDIDVEALKKYKRVILVAMGAKYQKSLKKLFDENDESYNPSKLFDLEDCYIMGDKSSTKLLDNDKEE